MKRYLTAALVMILAGMTYGQSPENSSENVSSENNSQNLKQEQNKTEEETATESTESSPTDESEINDKFHQQLQEIEVKGKSAWIEGNKYIFIPEKRTKNQASNMADMIEMMGTGVLRVQGGSIQTDNGQPVEIYINGVKADDMDKSTFWAKNAMRVEFMRITDDPRFAGSPNVVNFVMKEYVAGGLTNLETSDLFPGPESTNRISSKVAYRKMTYNVLAKYGYMYDHFAKNESRETFDDVWYDGKHYDHIEKVSESHSKTKNSNVYGGFNARYRNDKWTITHSASIQWNHDPGSLNTGTLSYTPDIISGNNQRSYSSSRTLSPMISGDYFFSPGGPWSFMGSWSFTHSHNNNLNENREGNEELILNKSKENVYGGGLMLYAGRRFGSKHSLQLYLRGNTSNSTIEYGGNTESRQKVGYNTGGVFASWYYIPIPKLYFQLSPTLNLQHRKVNSSYSTTQVLPALRLSSNYSFNSRHSINFSAFLSEQAPVSAMLNDLILRQTELKWIEGNPIIKSYMESVVGMGYTTYPASWVNSSLSLTWHALGKKQILEYRSGGREYDGVIGKYGNAHTLSDLSAVWRTNFKPFGGDLNIEPLLSYTYQRVRDLNNLHSFHYGVMLRYFFGNFRANLSFRSTDKSLVNGGMEILREPSEVSASIGYGNGNLRVHFDVDSPFRKYAKTTSTFVSGSYSYQTISWNRALKVNLYLEYTFDYGKKIDPSIDIQETDNSSTSVLGR